MHTQLRIFLNFWEAKQLEYWLKDNYPNLTVRCLYDNVTTPYESELFAVEGLLDQEATCMLKLKYGEKIRGMI